MRKKVKSLTRSTKIKKKKIKLYYDVTAGKPYVVQSIKYDIYCERNMMKQRKIELLAPAKNLECGIDFSEFSGRDTGADSLFTGK